MAEQKLHPDAQQVCDLIVASGRPPIETLTPPQAREAYLASRRVLQPDPEAVAEVLALEAPGPAGPIPLRLYRGQGADKEQPQPALVYFHGGGWVIGDLESHDQVCRALANAAAVHRRRRRLPAGAGAQVPGRRRGCHRGHALDRRQRGAPRHRRRPPGGRRRQRRRQPRRRRRARCARPRRPARWRSRCSSTPPPTCAWTGPRTARHAEQLPLTPGRHALVRRPLSAQAERQGGLAGLAAAGRRTSPGLPPALVITAGFDPLVR